MEKKEKEKKFTQIVEQRNSFKMEKLELMHDYWYIIPEQKKKARFLENQDWSCGMVSLYSYTIFFSLKSLPEFNANLFFLGTNTNARTLTHTHSSSETLQKVAALKKAG